MSRSAPICLHHPLEQRDKKDKMSLNPDFAPGEVSRFMSVVSATPQGVFQVSPVMEQVTHHPHQCITEYGLLHVPGYAPSVFGGLVLAFIPECQKQTVALMSNSQLFLLEQLLLNITENKPRGKYPEFQCQGLFSASFSVVCWEQFYFIYICWPLIEPNSKKQTACRRGADKRPIRQVIARVFFKS